MGGLIKVVEFKVQSQAGVEDEKRKRRSGVKGLRKRKGRHHEE